MLISAGHGDRTMTTKAGGMRLLHSTKLRWPKPGGPGPGTESVMNNPRAERRAMGVYLDHRTLQALWQRRARTMRNSHQLPPARAPSRDPLGTSVHRRDMNTIRTERGATRVCLARHTPRAPYPHPLQHLARGKVSSRQPSAARAQTRAWALFRARDHEQVQ